MNDAERTFIVDILKRDVKDAVDLEKCLSVLERERIADKKAIAAKKKEKPAKKKKGFLKK